MPSNTLQNYEQVGYAPPGGSMFRAQCSQIISDAVATRILVPREAGALCMFDSAAGTVYTLPTPIAGMIFNFAVSVSVTSNAHKIITSAATEFLVGSLTMVTIATASPAGFSANGTTIRAISAAGTTTGGLIGERYRVTAISATQWFVEGISVGSGTILTPFSTS